MDNQIGFFMAITIKREVCREIVKRLSSELEYYEAIVDKFRKKYKCTLEDKCTLEELEDRIKREGVPVDNHEIWEDSIEWRNAVEEAEKFRNLLEELKY